MDSIRPKAILLDLDDTIISFDHGVDADSCWRKAICKYMPEENTTNPEGILSDIKERAKWYWGDPVRHRIGRSDLTKARQEIITAVLMKRDINDIYLAFNIAASYTEERDKAITIFPDSIETIKQIRTKGIKLALLTNGNSEAQWKKIRRFDLAAFFDCIVVEGEFGVGKPEERIYFHALEQLGVAADETWMVGDNFDWEVAAPQRLGIKGIWIDHKGMGLTGEPITQPFMIIKSLGDLLALI
ncbi:HAD family hydrolase [Paenibacillus sp. PR3]|uniref:HAD family hydrolase n=1 Tax=Paenibacillus terricola TaxID=2763503 RepID=A0ABR8N1J9_9BACL|nr:HAD family hydrolase [Paenibacillus terricola]MBD3922062.1 HAD family hydrolase [Paenibacillus terricola]